MTLLFAACVPASGAPGASGHTTMVEIDNTAQLQRSLRIWQALPQRSVGVYSYAVHWQSAFGFGHSTTVEIKDGRVVRRSFEEWGRSDTPDKVRIIQRWQETAPDFGSHVGGAAPALTLDQLYELCAHLLRQPQGPDEQLTLVFDAAGLLKACHRRHTHVADDAPTAGIPYLELKLD